MLQRIVSETAAKVKAWIGGARLPHRPDGKVEWAVRRRRLRWRRHCRSHRLRLRALGAPDGSQLPPEASRLQPAAPRRTGVEGRLVHGAGVDVNAEGGGGALQRRQAAAEGRTLERARPIALPGRPAGSQAPPQPPLTGVASLATVKPFDSLVSCVAGASLGAGMASGISTPGRASVRGVCTREPVPPKSWARKPRLLEASAGAAWAAAEVEKARRPSWAACWRLCIVEESPLGCLCAPLQLRIGRSQGRGAWVGP